MSQTAALVLFGGRDIRRCRCTDPVPELRDAVICIRCGFAFDVDCLDVDLLPLAMARLLQSIAALLRFAKGDVLF